MSYDTDNSYTDSDFDSGSNPAWNEFLDAIPADYHEAVTPVLKKWDSGVNERFQKIHNEYADYKPFKENGYTSEQLDFAIGLAKALQEQPDEVWKALGEYHGYFDADDDDQEDVEDYNEGYSDPRLASLEEGYNLLAEAFIQQETAKQQALEDEALDNELDSLRDKYGDFDEEYVLTQMVAREVSAEDAVKIYHSHLDKVLSSNNRPKAPRVFSSSGGGIPQMRKPNLTSAKDRKAYGVEILQSMFNNR